jgi:hypothetical protein
MLKFTSIWKWFGLNELKYSELSSHSYNFSGFVLYVFCTNQQRSMFSFLPNIMETGLLLWTYFWDIRGIRYKYKNFLILWDSLMKINIRIAQLFSWLQYRSFMFCLYYSVYILHTLINHARNIGLVISVVFLLNSNLKIKLFFPYTFLSNWHKTKLKFYRRDVSSGI